MATRTAYPGAAIAGEVLTAANFNKGPGGWIGYGASAVDQTRAGTGQEVADTASTLTLPAGRRIKVTGRGGIALDAGASGTAALYVAIDDAPVSVVATSTSTAAVYGQFSIVTDPGIVATKYALWAVRIGGSGNVVYKADATRVGFCLVEDIGPAS